MSHKLQQAVKAYQAGDSAPLMALAKEYSL